MNPLPGVGLTLISNLVETPYSGMLPPHIAGIYSFDEAHIDLRPLTRFARCRLIVDTVTNLDPGAQVIHTAHHPPIGYDLLSVDIGSTPRQLTVPGAADYAIPAKPVPQLLAAWQQFLDQIAADPRPVSLGIVGGGVGGVELAFTMQARLWQVMDTAGLPRSAVTVHLFQRGPELMADRNRCTRRYVLKRLRQRGVQVHLNQGVTAIEAVGEQRQVMGQPGFEVICDRIIWVTNAGAPDWLAQTGLATDERGFLAVDDTLQSTSHPNVFAAGDIATMIHHPRPKAGVFAVRQGKPLLDNLKRQLQGTPLRPFLPQGEYLSLIDTGENTAIASRNGLVWESVWFRRWKHRIDSKFMARFRDFPPMTTAEDPSPMHCAGCGSKLGSAALNQALQQLQPVDPSPWPQSADVLVGLNQPDDAAVVRLTLDLATVHSVDAFPALVDDPYRFGQITVHHCLSDLWAMGATPQTALALVTLPYAHAKIQGRTLGLLMAGVQAALTQAKTQLIGGHTTEGPELCLGLSCNGIIHPDKLLTKGALHPGQTLILTKALGTGALFAADRQGQAKGRWIETAIAQMSQSNQSAAHCLQHHGATACTDVTGFGLIGHLLEMVQAAQLGAELNLSALPLLPGAAAITTQGYRSSLYPQNLLAANQIANAAAYSAHAHWPLLFDPQTAGGLLAALPPDQAERCLAALHHLHIPACILGQVVEPPHLQQPLTIKQWSS